MAQARTRTTTKTTYVPVATNIYFDGNSYRVRVTRNGKRTSQNFTSKRKIIHQYFLIHSLSS